MSSAPLADRIRPKTLEDVVGQKHLVGEGKVLRRIVETGNIPNMIFYGPSGVGKTTVARIVAEMSHKRLHKLNGTNASTADIKAVVEEIGTLSGYNGILLYLDEIQYLNKKQQQTLLEHIENGSITLIASTTENPYFYVYNAILSRSTVFEFKPIPREEVERAVLRGFDALKEEQDCAIELEEGVVELIANACGGDVRKSLNMTELAFLSAQVDEGDTRHIRAAEVEQLVGNAPVRYDRDADRHYDLLSALQKSIRGSDPDAAVYYLASILAGGDLVSACRRLLVIASEDVGLAYPQAVSIVKACVDSAMQLGLPEAQLPLGQAAVLMATAPKSNASAAAIWAAMGDVQAGKVYDPPAYLKDAHYSGAAKMGRGLTYQYPHDFPDHYVRQPYLPDEMAGVSYYRYGPNKTEQAAKQYWDKVKGK